MPLAPSSRPTSLKLSRAVRPVAAGLALREGYRVDVYSDSKAGLNIPVLAAHVGADQLFDVFLDLLEPLGEVLTVVLETSHHNPDGKHLDLIRENIDSPVLLSHFCDHEELLTHDGCTGVAVLSTTQPTEVQFDEHKLLVIYSSDLAPFESIFRRHGIHRLEGMKFITEAAHEHSSEKSFADTFQVFANRVGVEEPARSVNWE